MSNESTTLAFTAHSSAEIDAAYLATVMQAGGAAAQAYKQLSYDLLRVQPGMQVLDVGCGSGIDLANLRQLVGPSGLVIGLERNAVLVRQARHHLAATGAAGAAGAAGQDAARDRDDGTIMVMCADAERMPIPTASLDRVRADRALQHAQHPARVLAEMWRVLRPGGILAVVEPDWGMIGISPGNAGNGGNAESARSAGSALEDDPDAQEANEEDDAALGQVLAWMKRQLAHPLIGRQLHGLLHQMGGQRWMQIQVQPLVFQLDWATANPILEISRSVAALSQEQPALRRELEAWLNRVEEASARGTFWAGVPLIFATAQKVFA